MIWQDIATAPKDRQVLIYRKSGRICVAKYNRQEYHSRPNPYWDDYGVWGVIDMRGDSPTHWMPLPPAP